MLALRPALQARVPDVAVAVVAGVAAGVFGTGLPAAAGVAIAAGLFSELARRHTPQVPSQPRPPGDLYPLTKGEAEVARLVAEGLTNRGIAARIHRGERTVESRLQNCYNRLGFHSRSELTRWVTERDLDPSEPSDPKSVL